MADKSKYLMSRDQLIKLVLRDEFYTACPGLEDVQALAAASRAAYITSCRKSCCGGKPSLLAPALDALLDHLEAYQREAPEQLEVIRAFLASYVGSACRPVAIYYRKDRHTLRKIRF